MSSKSEARIPKIIHYCWFGGKKMPDLAHKCIATWQKIMPEYTLMLWNEESFDLNSNQYVKEAYQKKKYAFVTDYVRLWALHKFGGIYMDTDVEVLKPYDPFLFLPAFSGFETEYLVPTGVMASEMNGLWVRRLMSYYENKPFILQNGSIDTTTNVTIISELMEKDGFKLKNSLQNFNNIVTMFPKDYFCPKDVHGGLTLTENTVCIHHFNGSWLSNKQRIKNFILWKILGPKAAIWLQKTKIEWKNRKNNLPRRLRPSFSFSGQGQKQ